MMLFLKNVFSTLIVRFFCERSQKIFTFGKIRKFEEFNIFEKKTLSSFQQNWRAENMPPVAGRFIIFRHLSIW